MVPRDIAAEVKRLNGMIGDVFAESEFRAVVDELAESGNFESLAFVVNAAACERATRNLMGA